MSGPIVQTENGRLRGSVIRSTEGYQYCAFKGIPYAEPPIGALRFKDPVPLKPWSGVRDATKHGPICGQYLSRTVQGNDDCLYLNVYVKSIRSNRRLPVMVWIHGGAFTTGSGNDAYYGPDYLLRKDIILVTFNYRLGVFGFLNLEDEIAPGNQGLKDMVMVLKWVQQNIEKFGGDCNNVTVFGSSVGAASVHYLVLSHQSKGLIHKAIGQSGTAFHNWARTKDSKKCAIQLCKILGKNLQDSKEIVEFLTTVNTQRLVQAQEDIRRIVSKGIIAFCPFGPGVDDKSLNPFMPIPVEEAALEGVLIPYLLGHNSREGIWNVIGFKKETYQYIDENFEQSMQPRGLDTLKQRYNLTAMDVRRLYFNNEKISQVNRESYVDMCGDLYVTESVHRALKVQAEKNLTPTYYYKFSYAEEQTIMKALLSSPIAGACHYDEIEYLFFVNLRKQLGLESFRKGTRAYKMMQRMTEMWTNFATQGLPIPTTSNLLPEKWLPIDDGSNLRYLNINKEPKMETMPNLEHHFLSAKSIK